MGIFTNQVQTTKTSYMVDKIETVLAIIVTSLDGTIILTEDTNINVKEITKISQCYIEMLNNLDFEQQHRQQEQVKKNDHISSNRPRRLLTLMSFYQ